MSFGQYSREPKPMLPTFDKPKKRLRHIFDNPAHVWAHPRQKDGSGFEQTYAKNSTSNWYFRISEDGTRVMYSYRDSYVIASRFELGRKIIYLLRSGKPYSVTTSGQMNATRGAVPKNDKGVEVFTVPEMVGYRDTKPGKDEHVYNLSYYVAEISDALTRHASARSSYNIRGTWREATDLTAEAKRYARVFKIKLPALPKLPKLDAAKLAAVIARERIREEKAAAKRKLEQEEYEKTHLAEVAAWLSGPDACTHVHEDKPIHTFSSRWECERQREQEEWDATRIEKIAAWRRGEDVRLKLQYNEGALLRVRTFDADEEVAGDVGCVETSMSVQVPLAGPLGAVRLLRFLKALKGTGRTYKSNGHSERIGAFTVTSFDGQTLVAGCHRIEWSEIERVAPELGRLTGEQEIAWG